MVKGVFWDAYLRMKRAGHVVMMGCAVVQDVDSHEVLQKAEISVFRWILGKACSSIMPTGCICHLSLLRFVLACLKFLMPSLAKLC